MNAISTQMNISEIISNIKKEEILHISIPVDVYLQEAEDLARWMVKDLEELAKIGIAQAHLDDLQARISALREAQTSWVEDKKSMPAIQEKWNKIAKTAESLEQDLIASYRFAFREHPELLDKINKIARKKKQVDLVMDMGKLAMLGESNSSLLETIGFDMSQLKQAQELSEESSDILAQLNNFKIDGKETKRFRDQAYTYLKLLIDQIKEGGKYVFRNHPDRLKGYKSEYVSKKNLHARRKATQTQK
ncbi:hypothetical protein DF185_05545 [Marinifilum breve]|uniref:Uncharacterized protein n=1 Tax=Marinifilum breve TaxID=2184082 RepID=A0A2V4A077_9BACT|nr:hypothetical protein [Marinifilum breve]PXY02109.1 hypothetical protein DF185_05545 [Marinifilum breve]